MQWLSRIFNKKKRKAHIVAISHASVRSGKGGNKAGPDEPTEPQAVWRRSDIYRWLLHGEAAGYTDPDMVPQFQLGASGELAMQEEEVSNYGFFQCYEEDSDLVNWLNTSQYRWSNMEVEGQMPLQEGVNAASFAAYARGKSAPGHLPGPPAIQLTYDQVMQQIQLLPTRIIGRGSASYVFPCRWPQRFGTRAVLAAKVLRDPLKDSSAQLLQSFKDEVEVLAQCRHPNVVAVYGYCLEAPTVMIIMELLDGSLKDRLHNTVGLRTNREAMLQRNPSLSWILHDSHQSTCFSPLPGGGKPPRLTLREVVQLSVDVVSGLAYMHATPEARAHQQYLEDEEDLSHHTQAELSKRVIHRDLKPANVLINANGVAKLSDFGLARMSASGLVAVDHTQAGTLRYMAPELLSGVSIDYITPSVDLYSLGVMIWEMIAQEIPWRMVTETQVQLLVCGGQRPFTPGCPWASTQSINLSDTTFSSMRSLLSAPTLYGKSVTSTPAIMSARSALSGSPQVSNRANTLSRPAISRKSLSSQGSQPIIPDKTSPATSPTDVTSARPPDAMGAGAGSDDDDGCAQPHQANAHDASWVGLAVMESAIPEEQPGIVNTRSLADPSAAQLSRSKNGRLPSVTQDSASTESRRRYCTPLKLPDEITGSGMASGPSRAANLRWSLKPEDATDDDDPGPIVLTPGAMPSSPAGTAPSSMSSVGPSRAMNLRASLKSRDGQADDEPLEVVCMPADAPPTPGGPDTQVSVGPSSGLSRASNLRMSLKHRNRPAEEQEADEDVPVECTAAVEEWEKSGPASMPSPSSRLARAANLRLSFNARRPNAGNTISHLPEADGTTAEPPPSADPPPTPAGMITQPSAGSNSVLTKANLDSLRLDTSSRTQDDVMACSDAEDDSSATEAPVLAQHSLDAGPVCGPSSASSAASALPLPSASSSADDAEQALHEASACEGACADPPASGSEPTHLRCDQEAASQGDEAWDAAVVVKQQVQIAQAGKTASGLSSFRFEAGDRQESARTVCLPRDPRMAGGQLDTTAEEDLLAINPDAPADFSSLPHLTTIIHACWQQKPNSRPRAATVLKRLSALLHFLESAPRN